MPIDPPLALAGGLVGFLVGLTGMGGGAILTPLLVLVFGVPPLAAVSSDLVTSLVMKPFAGAVHLRRGTVHLRLFGWLAVGGVPAAFLASAGVGSLARTVDPAVMAAGLKTVIAVALLASLAATIGRPWLDRARQVPQATVKQSVETHHPSIDNEPSSASGPSPRRARRAATRTSADGGLGVSGSHVPAAPGRAALPVARRRTVTIGVVGGVAVGLTSVGSGSLVIAMLLLAYPALRPRELVGTDILQAIPLVGAAAVGHLLFGDVHFALTGSLLLGAIPGALLGAHVSSAAPDAVVRPTISAVLAASALALLGAPTALLLAGAASTALAVAAATRPPRVTAPAPAPAAVV